MAEPRIRIGGLMRCCIQSIQEYEDVAPADDDWLQCAHCNEALIYRDGAWEWASGRRLRERLEEEPAPSSQEASQERQERS